MINKLSGKIPDIFNSHIKPLDGLRGLSIILVIIAHTMHSSGVPSFFYAIDEDETFGSLGVNFFFFISGFLITGLMLKEYIRTGCISFKGFYWRRLIRIFPVFYFFLLFVYILSQSGIAAEINSKEFIPAMFYFSNFDTPFNVTWFLGHSWSLSVEEQYYLIWPLVVVLFLKKRTNSYFFILVLYHIIARVISYKYGHGNLFLNPFFTFIPYLLFGSLMSVYLFENEEKVISWFRRWNNVVCVPILFLAAFILTHFPAHAKFGKFFLPLGNVTIAFVVFIFFGLIMFGKNGFWRTFFSNSVIRFIGLVSYSWYIWQQIFLSRPGRPFFIHMEVLNLFPYNVFCSFIAAVISFYTVEKLFLKLKYKLK